MYAMSSSASSALDDARWAAVRCRDPDADGTFYYAVSTTGVYCSPSCAAHAARRTNVTFFATTVQAEHAGYRACLRCEPKLPPRAAREASMIAAACRAIEAAVRDDGEVALDSLADGASVSTSHFHRTFKRIAGVTPRAYVAATRQQLAQNSLRDGAAVTTAMFDAGFSSSGRFYEAAPAMLGMTPSSYRAGAPREDIAYAIRPCSLGKVLVAATTKGVCAILLGESGDELAKDLAARFSKATLYAEVGEFAAWVEQGVRLVDDPAGESRTLPLDIRGTAFQRRVWQQLRAIPAGETIHYAELASRIGSPSATRAVASACGANALAVAIPCHRVIGKDGAITGYRWGVERKRALLTREKARR